MKYFCFTLNTPFYFHPRHQVRPILERATERLRWRQSIAQCKLSLKEGVERGNSLIPFFKESVTLQKDKYNF